MAGKVVHEKKRHHMYSLNGTSVTRLPVFLRSGSVGCFAIVKSTP